MESAALLADAFLRTSGGSMHRQRSALVVGIVLLTGCGARTTPAVGFVNHTQHSDAQLWSLWKAAQQNLSQQIDLNPLQRTLNNASPHLLPGDSRVWNVSPRQRVVSSQADVSSTALYAATGTNRQDPTGLISCPAPCNVNYAARLFSALAASESLRGLMGILGKQFRCSCSTSLRTKFWMRSATI